MHFAKSGSDKKRIELSSDKGIASHIPLEVNKTLNSFLCVPAFRIEKCRTMITLYHGDRPAGFQERAELLQRTLWFGKMFEHETDKDMIKCPVPERELKDISLAESNIGDAFLSGHTLCPMK
jgi:hypothetical protein